MLTFILRQPLPFGNHNFAARRRGIIALVRAAAEFSFSSVTRTTNHKLTNIITLAGGLLLASTTAYCQATFGDGTFNPSDWTDINLGVGSFNRTDLSTGGNPGSYLVLNNTNNTAGIFEAVHLLNTAVYNPAVSGAITSLRYSIDAISISGAQAIHPVFLQSGVYWIAIPAHTTTGTWSTFGWSALDGTSFGIGPNQATSQTLDFSSTAAPLTFGFIGANRNFAGTNTVGVDNFSVSVTASAVPEPSTTARLASGVILGFVALRRRSRTR